MLSEAECLEKKLQAQHWTQGLFPCQPGLKHRPQQCVFLPDPGLLDGWPQGVPAGVCQPGLQRAAGGPGGFPPAQEGNSRGPPDEWQSVWSGFPIFLRFASSAPIAGKRQSKRGRLPMSNRSWPLRVDLLRAVMHAASTLTRMGAATREQLRGASAVDSRRRTLLLCLHTTDISQRTCPRRPGANGVYGP